MKESTVKHYDKSKVSTATVDVARALAGRTDEVQHGLCSVVFFAFHIEPFSACRQRRFVVDEDGCLVRRITSTPRRRLLDESFGPSPALSPPGDDHEIVCGIFFRDMFFLFPLKWVALRKISVTAVALSRLVDHRSLPGFPLLMTMIMSIATRVR